MRIFKGRNNKKEGKASHLKKGALAESQALAYLQQQGLSIVERNYLCRHGEIDLIMTDGNSLVFVEVRYRNNDSFGSPAASVTATKQNKIRLSAKHYLQVKDYREAYPVRFDVIGITSVDNKVTQHNSEITWIPAAFY